MSDIYRRKDELNEKHEDVTPHSDQANPKQVNTEATDNKIHEEGTSALPLQGAKPGLSKYAWIGLGILFFGIFLQGLIFHHEDNKDKKTQEPEETFTTKSPLTKELNDKSAFVNSLDKEHELQRKIAEAKAKDFVDRLQVSQNAASDTSGQSQMASNDPNRDPSNNANQNPFSSVPTDSNTAFLTQASHSQVERSMATFFGPSSYVIGQGKFIFGTLALAINSDLPGQIEAVVNQDVYGEQGRKILIPRGSHLIGEYRSGLSNHQNRLFTVWTRIKEPNGIDISLGSPGTDSLGEGGQAGQVDYHFLDRFGGALLISMISAGASNVGVSTSDQYNSISSYRQSVSQALAEQAKNTLDDHIQIPPTIHIAQGERIVVFVNRDLDFSRVYR